MANLASHPSGVGLMSSNPLMIDYEGGDLLLAGAACGRLLGHCAGLRLQVVGGDLKTAWRSSFK